MRPSSLRTGKYMISSSHPSPYGGTYVCLSRFDDDNAHIACVAHSVVQDSLWLNKAAQAISKVRHSCYFVTKEDGNVETSKRFHVIMPLPESFQGEYDAAWRRLVRDDFPLKLRFFRSAADSEHLETWYNRFLVGFNATY